MLRTSIGYPTSIYPISILTAILFALALNFMVEPSNGQEISFLEDFVLAENRETALKQLVPGTEPYYYYHCLHYQNTRQFSRVDELMKPWKKRFGESSLYRQIRDRKALLVYSNKPEVTLDYVRRELQLNFNHQREIPQAQRNLASELDPSKLKLDTLVQDRLRQSTGLEPFTDQGLKWLAGKELNNTQRRQLLTRLSRPDFPNLVQLIHEELQERDSQAFGKLNIHRQLTLAQLDKLASLRPRLTTETGFVYIYMAKLVPSNDSDWFYDDQQRIAYLERLWEFVEPLEPSFNSLKANVLYRLLALDLQHEKYDRERFMAYLKLPRNLGYVNPVYIKNVRSKNQLVQLNSDYSRQIYIAPIRQDQTLVEQYLSHFLRDADDYREFEPYLRDTFLKQHFAETKILAGIGDVEKWASMLSPERYQELLKRVDLDFAPTNPKYFNAEDEVNLDLFTMNVKSLIVKVFEINTSNYYRKHGKEIDTDINLDGLVPNFETTHTYDDPPALRKRRTFDFPQLDKRGVFIIDFIAGGKSSRALIRKGRLNLIGNVNAAGHSLRVIDQQANTLKRATVWIAGRQYTPDEDGLIQIPFSTRPGLTKAIVTDQGFSALHEFKHRSENYKFTAAIVLDRENLTRHNEARVVIRPSLQVADSAHVPLAFLEDHSLDIVTTNLDGISASRTLNELEFKDDQETICNFMVPPRTKTISLTLKTQIKNVSRDQQQTLVASETFNLNAIDDSDMIQDFHLVPSSDGYFLEALGKSGEVRPNQAVRIGFQVAGFRQPIQVDLQSNENGRIRLGPLADVYSIEVKPSVGQPKTWTLQTQDQTYAKTIHIGQGQQIEIPAPPGVNEVDRDNISIFEVRLGQIVRDVFENVSFKRGLLVISKLEPGDYSLQISSLVGSRNNRINHRLLIRVADGNDAQGIVVNRIRHVELGNRKTFQISTIAGNQDKVRVEIENPSPETRVHVFASRYQPAYDTFAMLTRVRGMEPWTQRPADRRSVYQQGRTIGDEYDYILRRKYARKFPGNMLERPSLLLNPWSPRETQNEAQEASLGDEFGMKGNATGADASRAPRKRAAAANASDFANLDFVGDGSVLLTNLRPNKNGVVTIDRKLLGINQHVRVIAVDGGDTVQRNINFGITAIDPRDARLMASLAPDKHFSQSKQTDLLAMGDSVKIDDLVSARFQQYDDLKDVFTLLQTLNNNSTLSKFRFVLDWNDKSEEERRALYSEFACHELNYFLFKKDPAFFKSVVLRHLKNKRVKTFMDHYLLREELESYTRPWEFARLNTFERILLAQRLEQRKADLVRSLNELYLVAPTPREEVDRFYDTSIDALGLDVGPQTFTYNKDKALKRSRSQRKELFSDITELSRAAPDGGGGGRGGLTGEGGDMEELAESIVVNGRQIERTKPKRPMMLSQAAGQSAQLKGKLDEEQNSGGDMKSSFKRLAVSRERLGRLYRRVAATKEWIENNYYQVTPDQQTPELVPMNQFWRDFANHEAGTFLSPHFAEAHPTFTSTMFALAVLDLPLKASDHKTDYVDNTMTFTAGGPAIVLHQQVRPTQFERGNTKILVSENYFQKNDRYRYEEGVQFDKFISEEFLAHTLYGSQVVITNPTSTPRQVEILVQIPAGSVACSGSQETRTTLLSLEPFSTQTLEYSFYFPTAGKFQHYPAHVSSEDQVLAVADGIEFNVVDRQAELDKASWEFVSQNGSDDEVIDFINNNNVLRLNLAKIAFRMKEKAFFKRAIAALRNRYVFDSTLWSYAIKHNDIEAIREFMTHDNPITNNCGIEFDCELVTINPTQRNWYSHKEYWPLINARAHQLGPQRKILNDSFHTQYHAMLSVLAQHRELSDDDHLVLTYYLLLQDRIDAALDHFSMVSLSKVNSEIQYHYCDAYLDFYRGKPDAAAKKAEPLADYPVDHWRKRFQAILSQVEEIKGARANVVDELNALQQQTALAAKSESIDLEVVNGTITLRHQNTDQVQVNFYEMDIELLFSRSPFAQDELDGFSMIKPNATKSLKLKSDRKGRGAQEIKLPASMKNKNVLVEVTAGDQVRSQPFYANSLDVKLQENYGQLVVSNAKSGKPIAKTYVKVYARMQGGEVRFHKDGYTDLRGRFDYATQSNRSPDGIEKLSILILSEDNGAVTREATMPKE